MSLSLDYPKELVQICLDEVEGRSKTVCYDRYRNALFLPVYTQHDSVISGHVMLNFPKPVAKNTDMQIQLIGETETYHENDVKDVFLLQTKKLETPDGRICPFSFKNFEFAHETYYSTNGRIRYYIKVTVDRGLASVRKAEVEIAVQLPVLGLMYHNQSYEIQLRIADYLRVDVDINRTNFHLDDIIVGKLTIQQIQLGIKRIQIGIQKKETYNPCHTLTCTKEDIIETKQLIDYCPKKGQIIPFKLGLSGLDLSPNLLQSNPKIFTKYVLVMSFIDDEDRSLFKPIEINLWRKK